ncbi:hypothetical protein [Nocardia otitidiscaviarum]|uniref:hypothetical protein n=1 Tax=Nocardia otitidiscaviarum TaxID=1823 RepID=UPI002457505A|nr:hypothetical protein [Nocardia otitidiscaviarum]
MTSRPARDDGTGHDHAGDGRGSGARGVGGPDDAGRPGAGALRGARGEFGLRAPVVRRAGIVLGGVVFVVLLLVLGWAQPPVRSVVTTDRLGPDHGERVSDYLDRARESLRGNDSDQHWALLSFAAPIIADRIPAYTDGLRIAQVLLHVDIPRVYTPVTTITVPSGDAPAVASARSAAALLRADAATAPDARTAAALRLAATRLDAGCACVVGLNIRGTLDQLRKLAAHSDIRVIEALPADAGGGTYALVPLLPRHQDYVVPGPDDGPIPEN